MLVMMSDVYDRRLAGLSGMGFVFTDSSGAVLISTIEDCYKYTLRDIFAGYMAMQDLGSGDG
jgi:hypothetical protein